MTSPRTDRKTDYRHFPAEYGDMFAQFAREGSVRLGPMPYVKANSSRRDLYRFRLFLINAVEEDPEDTFARDLYDAARNVTMRIEGAGNRCWIVLELNPIVAAMRQPETPIEAGSDPASEPFAEGESRQEAGESRQDQLICPITTGPCTDARCTSGWCQLMSARHKEHLP